MTALHPAVAPGLVRTMGEAWFMGTEREMYPELLGDLNAVAIEDLQKPLGEIASGTSSFGPMEEWHSWFHYLLGQVLPRGHKLADRALPPYSADRPQPVDRESQFSGFDPNTRYGSKPTVAELSIRHPPLGDKSAPQRG